VILGSKELTIRCEEADRMIGILQSYIIDMENDIEKLRKHKQDEIIAHVMKYRIINDDELSES
tara:strand:+ start:223 stop:411 length:189 start_codon:yes stop_codon:yes gene_type:complete